MTTPPEIIPTQTPDVTSDDRIWVILCFLFTPLFSIITLFMDDKKNRPFIKYHYIPVLILGVVEIIAINLLALIPVVRLFTWLVWFINVYFAIKANSGKNVDNPFITDFSKKQGWS
jgi:uncharacterized membrane protein